HWASVRSMWQFQPKPGHLQSPSGLSVIYEIASSTAMDLGQEEANPWRESLEQRLRERMRELIEQVLEEEVEEALGAPRSQRAATRSGYRHGVKPRRLVLRGGAVQVAVPRARSVTPAGGEREWQSRLVPRYRRATP